MSLRFNPKTGDFVVTTSQKVKADDTGLTFSKTASGPNGEPVYFTKSPYAALNFFREGDGAVKEKLAPLWSDYEKSWAVDSPNKYPIGREIEDLGGLRGYQNAAIDYALGRRHTLIGDAPGIGKGNFVGAKNVLTPTGWVDVSDLQLGSEVIARDGSVTRVTGLFPRGMQRVMRVNFRDGTFAECDPSHLWAVRNDNHRRRGGHYRVKSTEEIQTTYSSVVTHHSHYEIPVCEPIQFEHKNYVIDPYILGVLIGDGSLTEGVAEWATPDMDADIVKRVTDRLMPGYSVTRRTYTSCPHYTIIGGNGVNAYRRALKEMDVTVRSVDKRVPVTYLWGSPEQRLDLLRGLMDTDGTSMCGTHFSSLSRGLADDVCYLVRSLGGFARLSAYDRNAEDKGIEYRVNVRMPVCPFYTERKATRWRPPTGSRRICKYITSVEDTGRMAESICISVAHPEHLYIINDFIVTHNTLTAIGACNAFNAEKVLVVCPAAIRPQWKREIKRGSIIDKVRVYPILRSADGVANWPNYTVISYDLLRNPDLHAALCAIKWDALILDEAHALKEIGARRTQALFGGGRREEFKDALSDHCERILALTGTPLPNRPRECYTLTRAMCWDAIDYMTADDFRYRYNPSAQMTNSEGKMFVREEKGRLPELQARLRCNYMVRRLKEDVLKDLPDKTYEFAYIEKDGRIADVVRRERMLNYTIQDLKKPNVQMFGEISTIRREMGEAKVPQAINHIRFLLDIMEIEKIVIFSHHRSVMDALRQGLQDYGVVEVRGGMTERERKYSIAQFAGDPEKGIPANSKIRIFSGQLEAAGVGIDGLQAVCSHVVVVEPAWTSGSNEQAIDRLHRSGQHGNVIAQFIVVEGSLDERILALVIDKTHTVHEALDNRKTRPV